MLRSTKGHYILKDEWYSLLMMMVIDFDSFVCLLNNKKYFRQKDFYQASSYLGEILFALMDQKI